MSINHLVDICQSKENPKELAATNRHQTLWTPGFWRMRYPTNVDCHWVIRASDARNRLQIFVWFSQIEDKLFTDCDDYMQIRDGANLRASVIAQWCGLENPLSVTSSYDALYVQFKSDSFSGSRGVNLTYVEFNTASCPDTWLPSSDMVYCYRLTSAIRTWVEAQKHCNYDRSNLLSIENENEYRTVFNIFSTYKDTPWVGLNDAETEGTFANIDRSDNKWPQACDSPSSDHLCFPNFDQKDDQDCLYFDPSGGSRFYELDDCRTKRAFICKKRRDGTTIPYPPSERQINTGLIRTAGEWNFLYLWLIMGLVALIVFIIVFICLVKRAKRKQQEARAKQLIQTNETFLNGPGSSSDSSTSTMNKLIRAYDNVSISDSNSKRVMKTCSKLSKTVVMYENQKTVRNPSQTTAVNLAPSTAPISYYVNGRTMSNGIASDNKPKLKKINLPPVENFNRPDIRVLDNASALSLDEFWTKVDASKIRQINVEESPPIEL